MGVFTLRASTRGIVSVGKLALSQLGYTAKFVPNILLNFLHS